MEEMLDLVNEQGDPLGRAVPRSEAHRLGLRHRTSHVWLGTPQKRRAGSSAAKAQ